MPLEIIRNDITQVHVDAIVKVVSRILRTFVDGVPRRFQLTSATVST